jgi:ADP-ribosyl-[dinitrogen reductase] hydrolase
MLGAIIGDIAGSIYEFDNYRAKDFEFFGRGADFTDDTVCTIAVADALLNDLDPAQALVAWCKRYPGRGYGGMFARWIESREPKPYNSFGNGVAEALFGVPQTLANAGMAKLPDEMRGVVERLY